MKKSIIFLCVVYATCLLAMDQHSAQTSVNANNTSNTAEVATNGCCFDCKQHSLIKWLCNLRKLLMRCYSCNCCIKCCGEDKASDVAQIIAS